MPRFSGRLRELNHGGCLLTKDWLKGGGRIWRIFYIINEILRCFSIFYFLSLSAAILYYLLSESEVITGKSQTEALMYWPSDGKVNTSLTYM